MEVRSRRKVRRAAAAAFVIAASLFLGLAVAGSWEELRTLRGRVADYPWRAEPSLLLASLAAAAVALALSGLAWARLFRAAAGRIGYRSGLFAWLASNLGRYIPGRVWQLSGLAAYLKGRGESGASALASALLAQAVTLATGIAAAAVSLAGRVGPWQGGAWLPVGVLVAAVALLLHPRAIEAIARVAGRWLGERVEFRVRGAHLVEATGAFAAVWLLYGLGFWCFLRGVVGPAAPGLVEATGIFAASYVTGFLVVFAPGGLVAREGAMAALLAALTPIPTAVAAAVAVAARLWLTVVEVGTLGASWMARGSGGMDDTRREAGEAPAGADDAPGTEDGTPVDGEGAAPGAGERARATRALVILPTYNEVYTLPVLVPRILETDPRLDVLVIDDNSPDGTGELAARLAAERDRVSVLLRPGKMGLGSAYLAGFREALARGYGLAFEMDADLSHDPKYLPDFLTAIREHDLVVGSRYLRGVNVINWPMGRLLLSWFANRYARAVTGVPLTDSTSGFKCFRREVLETVDLSRVQSTGYAFQIEMNLRAWKAGFRVGEVPIVFVDRESGSSKMTWGIVWEAVWRVWVLRLRAALGLL